MPQHDMLPMQSWMHVASKTEYHEVKSDQTVRAVYLSERLIPLLPGHDISSLIDCLHDYEFLLPRLQQEFVSERHSDWQIARIPSESVPAQRSS